MDSKIMIRLPGEVRQRIEEEAEGERRTMSNMTLVLIEEALTARDEQAKKAAAQEATP